jgi:hypothetical protein
MPELVELLQQLIGPETEGGEAAAEALTHPHGIAATSFVHMLVLQSKPNLTEIESELLKGYAHHDFDHATLQQADSLERRRWLASVREAVYSTDDMATAGGVSYVDSTSGMSHRLTLIEHACAAIVNILEQADRSAIDAMALASYSFRLGQVQWLEVSGERRYNLFKKMPPLTAHLKLFCQFRDAIRHPNGKAFDKIVEGFLVDFTVENIQTLQAAMQRAVAQQQALAPQWISCFNTGEPASPAPESPDVESPGDGAFSDPVHQESTEFRESAMCRNMLQKMSECKELAGSMLESAIAKMLHKQQQGEHFYLTSFTHYWLLYMLATENNWLLYPSHLKAMGSPRIPKEGLNIKSLIGRAYSNNHKLDADYAFAFVQLNVGFGTTTRPIDILSDLIEVLLVNPKSPHVQSIVQLMAYLFEHRRQELMVSDKTFIKAWKRLCKSPHSLKPEFDVIHQAFSGLMMQLCIVERSKEQVLKLMNCLYQFDHGIRRDLSLNLLSELLKMVQERVLNDGRRAIFIECLLQKVTFVECTHYDVCKSAKTEETFTYTTWKALDPIYLRTMLKQPFVVAHLHELERKNVHEANDAILITHPYVKLLSHWVKCLPTMLEIRCLGRDVIAHKRAVCQFGTLRDGMHKKFQMLWGTFREDSLKDAFFASLMNDRHCDVLAAILPAIDVQQEVSKQMFHLFALQRWQIPSNKGVPEAFIRMEKWLCAYNYYTTPGSAFKTLRTNIVQFMAEMKRQFNLAVIKLGLADQLSFADSGDRDYSHGGAPVRAEVVKVSGGGGAAVPRRAQRLQDKGIVDTAKLVWVGQSMVEYSASSTGANDGLAAKIIWGAPDKHDVDAEVLGPADSAVRVLPGDCPMRSSAVLWSATVYPEDTVLCSCEYGDTIAATTHLVAC